MEHVTHRAVRTTLSLPAQRTPDPAPAEPGSDHAEQFHYAERLAELLARAPRP